MSVQLRDSGLGRVNIRPWKFRNLSHREEALVFFSEVYGLEKTSSPLAPSATGIGRRDRPFLLSAIIALGLCFFSRENTVGIG
jgi:hypothetical protein